MQTRAMGPGTGWQWLLHGVNMGRSNPKAIFGGAALLLGSVIVLAIGLALLVGGLETLIKPGLSGSMALGMLLAVPILAVVAALTVGYLRLIDAVENGRAARAMDIFKAFNDKSAIFRAMGFVLLLAIVQNLIVVALVGTLAPDFGHWYLQNIQASMSGAAQQQLTSLPHGFGIAFAIMLVIGLFSYAVQAIGLGQIALRGRGVAGALTDGVGGTAKNLLPLIVLTLVVIVAACVFVLLAALLVMLIGLLVKLAGVWIGILLGIPLYIGVLLVMYVVMFGVMYSVWRDVAGGGVTEVASASNHRVEL
ncbi:MAG: hypothetical protein ABJA62_04330 [Luteimonas sp.]